ncbi:hypothetical protein SEVIR_5G037501v4 [Setaria viridis]
MEMMMEEEEDHLTEDFLEAMGLRPDDLQEQEPTGSYPMEVDAAAAGVRSGDLQQKQDDVERAAMYEALFGGPCDDDDDDLVTRDREMPRGAVAADGDVHSDDQQQQHEDGEEELAFWEKASLDTAGEASPVTDDEPSLELTLRTPHTPVTDDEPSLELTLRTPHTSIR